MAKKVYESDEVQVNPLSGGTTVSWLKDAGLEDTIQAAPVTDLGGGRYQAQDLPDGYSYVHYSGMANDPTQTEATRGDWGIADNAWTSDEDWNAIQGYKAQYEQAKAVGDTAAMEAAHAAAEKIRNQYGYSGGVDGSNYLPTMAYTGVTSRDEDGERDWGGSSGSSGGFGGGFSYENAPEYLSKYQERIDALADTILNRKEFTYDPETDPTYQQYKASYTRDGKRAMQDTLAQVSARTGGLASSYAQGASQQAYNNYMAQLADKIPELKQLAYSMYMDDLNQDRNDLSMLQGMEQTDYGKYLDQLGQWNTDRGFEYGKYRDEIGDSQWQQQFDYGVHRDNVADSQWQQQFGYQKQQDALAQQNWQTQWDYQLEQDALAREDAMNRLLSGSGSSGGGFDTEPTTDLQAIYGMRNEAEVYDYLVGKNYSAAEVENYINYWRQNRYSKENNAVPVADADKVKVPNYGSITYDEAERLVQKGALVVIGLDKNGDPIFALPDDWNKNNTAFETAK